MTTDLTKRFLEICDLLIEKNIVKNQAEIADTIKCSKSLISECRAGRSNIGLMPLNNFQRNYNINNFYLFDGVGNIFNETFYIENEKFSKVAEPEENYNLLNDQGKKIELNNYINQIEITIKKLRNIINQ